MSSTTSIAAPPGQPRRLSRKILRQFQRAAGQFIRDTKKCALFVDMGLGKTISVLTVLRDLADDYEIGRVLIVGPPRVVTSTWPDEIKLWDHTRNFTFTNLDGTPKRRMKRLVDATEVHLISHDLVPWLDDLIGEDHDYDVIIVDESSRFKNQATKRWTAMRRLVQRARYVVLLTGTPAPNGLHDLWAQIYLLDQGKRLGHTITSFRERWFEQNWGSQTYRAKEFADERIRDRIADICFTLRDADYADLPPRIDNFIRIKLPPEIMAQYKAFQKDYILELEDGDKIKAVTAAALTNKLLQLSNGVVYDKERNEKFLHKLKVDALEEIIEEANGQPVFVAYNFRTDIKAIKARFPQAVVMGNNPQTVKDWNAGLIPILIAHPKSAGHGLNLQHGGSIAVWYGLTWSLEDYQQLNKRLHRPGQTRTVVIHHLLCEGTIDEHVLVSLQGKDEVQTGLLDSLRRLIKDTIEEEA